MGKQVQSTITKWKYFHVGTWWGTLGNSLETNLTLDQALLGFVCPFIQGTPYPTEGGSIRNPRGLLDSVVFGTERPVDNSWPPLDDKERDDTSIVAYLRKNGHTCSNEAYEAALLLIESGAYKDVRARTLSKYRQNFVFMISVLGNPDVDKIYSEVVRPRLSSRGFHIERSDEIRRTELITESIANAITASRFVIADLTDDRPNSYYELGYAHALGKPGVIIARKGTKIHFDVSGYRWNFWSTADTFGAEFDAIVAGVIQQLSSEGKPPVAD